ncbi:MAG: hypothetical protein ACI4E1_02415 [Lachnospira sp.]
MKNKNFCVGNMLMILAIVGIIFNAGMQVVLGAQGNADYSYAFDYEGDEATTESRSKWYTNDSAYINCTFAEDEDSYFSVQFYFWNEYDGTQYANASGYMWKGSQKWVANSALEGDTTWFKGTLEHFANDNGEGVIFSGRWRPDSSSY